MPIYRNARVFIGQFDLTGDSNALQVDYGVEAQDVTVFGDTTRRFQAGLTTIGFNLGGFVAFGTNALEDALFNRIGLNQVPISFSPENAGAAGEEAFFFRGMFGEYAPGETVGNMLGFSASGGSSQSEALVRGTVLEPGDTNRTATGQTAGQQVGAVGATEFLYAVLHVFTAGGTTLDVTIESDDAVGFPSPTTQITFTQVTTVIGAQFATPVAGAIADDWWRANYAITGAGPYLFAASVGIQ